MAQRQDFLAKPALEEEEKVKKQPGDAAIFEVNATQASHKAHQAPASLTQEVLETGKYASLDGKYLQSIAGQALAVVKSASTPGSIITDTSQSHSVCEQCINGDAPCSVLNRIFGRE
jgi:hypothetical protein